MSRTGSQNVSYLPVERAVRALDGICARHPQRGWDDDAVRDQLFSASREGLVEIGTAKRILHAAQPQNTLPMNSIAGMERLKELWNRMRILSDEGRREQRVRRRRRIDDTARNLLEEGLATMDRWLVGVESASDPDESGIICRSAAVAKALHGLAAEIGRSDATKDEDSAAWQRMGQAGRAIRDLETFARRAASNDRRDPTNDDHQGRTQSDPR